MADNITLKRIVDLVAQTDVDETVYTIIDSVSGTVKKYPIGSLICSIAPIFDSTADYLAGAYCNYNGQLYVFTEDHDAGAWTGSDVSTVTLTDIAEAHGGDLAELEAAVTALETAVDGKADSAGVYENLTAGNALQLASNKGVEDSAPYFFRPTPADATREEVDVVGGSVVENQYAPQSAEDPAWAESGVAVTWSGSEATITCTNDETAIKQWSKSVTANHVWLAMANMKGTATTRLGFFNNTSHAELSVVSVTGGGAYEHKDIMYKPTVGAYAGIRLPNTATTEDTAQVKNVQLVDLTAKLGPTIADYIYTLEQATAGAGYAWYTKYFGTDYKPHSAPTIKSVEGVSAHKLVGFNQWDEQWEQGAFNWQTGEPATATSRIRSKNFIPVIPGADYFFGCTNISASVAEDLVMCKYAADKSYLGYTNIVYGTNQLQTMPADCAFIKFATVQNYGGTYKNDICINISDPARNGQYEPYTAHTYAMDGSVTLRGIPKIADGEMYFDGDTYSADGTVTRKYRLVDLGSLNWALANTAFYASVSGIKHGVSEVNIVTDRYKLVNATSGTGSANEWADKIVRGNSGTYSHLYIKDTSYQTPEAFKAAMDGVYAVIELQTPTTESATPYTTPQICAPGGTEEWVTSGVVPVGHRTWYPTNQVGKLDGLPKDFSTLIAPTEKTNKASQNYAQGAYFIYQNTLYKVTSAIASGGTITPGTNCTATTVMAELVALTS